MNRHIQISLQEIETVRVPESRNCGLERALPFNCTPVFPLSHCFIALVFPLQCWFVHRQEGRTPLRRNKLIMVTKLENITNMVGSDSISFSAVCFEVRLLDGHGHPLCQDLACTPVIFMFASIQLQQDTFLILVLDDRHDRTHSSRWCKRFD